MIRIQNIQALFIKQIKDFIKNTPILVLFLVYPIIVIMMTSAMGNQSGAGDFITIFATMHCVFSPAVSSACILAEEKEQNTLRLLIMSNVTLREYFISIGGFILIANLITGASFLFLLHLDIASALVFMGSLALGSLISTILGFCIGLFAKNASAANGLAVPFGMIFAFLPMLSSFNKGIESVSRFTFGQQITYLLKNLRTDLFGVAVITSNLILLICLATILYRKSLTEE